MTPDYVGTEGGHAISGAEPLMISSPIEASGRISRGDADGEGTRASLVIIILTFNSAPIIERTITAAAQITSEIVCVDSGSTDATPELVKSLGCELLVHTFENYSSQRNWAIGLCEPKYAWQLHLDADEVVDGEAILSIKEALAAPGTAEAFLIRRVTYFMGRRLRFGGAASWHLRLFRSGSAKCEERLYDQHFVSAAKARRLKSGVLHDMNAASLSEWTLRHNRWSDLEAAEVTGSVGATRDAVLKPAILGDPRQRTRLFKGVYYRGPLLWRASLYFFYRYVLRGGFLDGRAGFIYNVLQAFWFRCLVDAKIAELQIGSDIRE